jgi:cytochrome c1
MTTTKPASKLMTEALALFAVKDEKGVSACLYALGLRQACTRCGGSGHYSFNRVNGTVCFGCNGQRQHAAKLTREVLEAARVKVAAGDLEAIRAANRARKAARKDIAPLVTEACAVYDTIGNAYTEASRGDDVGAFIRSPMFYAQTMNNSLRGAVWEIEHAVKTGKRHDYPQAVAELAELVDLLKTLRAAWLAIG